MKKKTIFITGSSVGIGRAAVELFSRKGWNVAATMRTPEKENALHQLPNVKLYKLDVLDLNTIKSAVSKAIADFGYIDVLINNAGYGALGPFEAATKEQIREQFDTNVTGLLDVTQEMLPHFRERKSGVIINISSVAGRVGFPLYSLYNGTKWAVEGFSESLQYELRQFGIRVKLVEPGPIKTEFDGRSKVVLQKDGLTAYNDYSDKLFANMSKAAARASGADKVAKTIYKAATDNRNKLRYPVGGGAPMLMLLRRMIPNSWFYTTMRIAIEG
jgi:NAD(P)-dependent dehydrogenase (short-subunit alcohol dehydrogenase family)